MIFLNINTLSQNSSVLALLSRRNKDGSFLVLGSTVLKPDFDLKSVFDVSMDISGLSNGQSLNGSPARDLCEFWKNSPGYA